MAWGKSLSKKRKETEMADVDIQTIVETLMDKIAAAAGNPELPQDVSADIFEQLGEYCHGSAEDIYEDIRQQQEEEE